MVAGIIVVSVVVVVFFLFILDKSKNIEKPGEKCYYNALEEEIKSTKR